MCFDSLIDEVLEGPFLIFPRIIFHFHNQGLHFFNRKLYRTQKLIGRVENIPIP